jgi:Endosomal/lysosomal potassium channel TMEM175
VRQVKRPAAVLQRPGPALAPWASARPQHQKAGGRGQAAELAVTSRTRQSTTVMSVAPGRAALGRRGDTADGVPLGLRRVMAWLATMPGCSARAWMPTWAFDCRQELVMWRVPGGRRARTNELAEPCLSSLTKPTASVSRQQRTAGHRRLDPSALASDALQAGRRGGRHAAKGRWEMTGSADGPGAHHPDGDSHKTLDRLMAFSDAVFAIAMTLLVVQFRSRPSPEACQGRRSATGWPGWARPTSASA